MVKQLFTTGDTVFELPLKLARKKFRTLGYAAFEDEVLNQNQIQKVFSLYKIFNKVYILMNNSTDTILLQYLRAEITK